MAATVLRNMDVDLRKIRNEIERNRRGDYKIPTWVLAAGLVAFLAAWALLIILS